MRAFMTTGTTHFLQNIMKKHPKEHFYLMKSGISTLIYYESTKKKSIFVSGKTYEVIFDSGSLAKTGFVVMDHIPIAEEEIAVFQERTKQQIKTLQQAEGIVAAKLLKEQKNHHFIILTQWKTEGDHQKWKQESSSHTLNFTKNSKLPAYFLNRPFTNHYYMLNEEEI